MTEGLQKHPLIIILIIILGEFNSVAWMKTHLFYLANCLIIYNSFDSP